MKNKDCTDKNCVLKHSLLIASSSGKSSVDLEEPSTKGLEPKAPRIKEVLKERKVLEKKVALSKKRKKDSRYVFIWPHSHYNILSACFQKRGIENDSKEPDLECAYYSMFMKYLLGFPFQY